MSAPSLPRPDHAAEEARDRTWPWAWIGTLVGIGIGLGDFVVMLSFGADLKLSGQDVTAAVLGSFVVSYGLLGYAMGRVAEARARARRDANTIAVQLEQLERAQRELVQQEKLAAIGRLAAGVAHEVRNPLGVIRASASMVKESFEAGEDPYRACEFICEEIDRLDGLIHGLLTFSRPTRPQPEKVSLEKLVDHALQLADAELAKRGITVEREADGATPELTADPDLLAQLIFGLILNAAQALEGEGRIVLRTRFEAPGWRLEVADSGPGVSPEDAAHVFEPFFTTKATGTGLGLAMAERIAEAHDGTLALVPGAGAGPDGSGACFALDLPSGSDS
ncbi:MAG: ATP-binding protein [Proteobacteria bacterium]|nr:ATP-binding protein [Pseudomonadota bacterium]